MIRRGLVIPVQVTEQTIPVPTKLLYDRKSAAFTLSISVRSLDYLIANKRLNTIKMGSKVMVSHGSLVKFSRQHHASLTEQDSQNSRE
ncbi:hypothetical protein HDF16_000743 [Granulicella aggregans]|uniref:Excisionase family DNA binding protein n=1 Tax=Granulicella aggregans TaxID=474949 RepID=A0A7W8E2D4_9BACT|nr:hypothetical protein [Granulicella aggregans]MBB5056074.1 hypothetical protein [Granulicella aggregans]